jgi:hypothetical protein
VQQLAKHPNDVGFCLVGFATAVERVLIEAGQHKKDIGRHNTGADNVVNDNAFNQVDGIHPAYKILDLVTIYAMGSVIVAKIAGGLGVRAVFGITAGDDDTLVSTERCELIRG